MARAGKSRKKLNINVVRKLLYLEVRHEKVYCSYTRTDLNRCREF